MKFCSECKGIDIEWNISEHLKKLIRLQLFDIKC